jgi:hypothetical protein
MSTARFDQGNSKLPPAQVALRMVQCKRAMKRHPRAAMGALAHWLRSLDHATPAPLRTTGETASHTAAPPACSTQPTPPAAGQK